MPGGPAESPLQQVYRACAPAAFRRARELLGNEADAWDVVHEVFAKLAEGGRVEQIRSKPMTYIYRATTNAALNVLAARKVRAGASSADTLLVPGDGSAVHARDLLEKLDDHLDDLDRQILVLTFHDGLSQDELAEVLDVWRRTIGRRLKRLRLLVDALEALPAEALP